MFGLTTMPAVEEEMSETLLAKHRQRCGDAVENTFDVDVDHVLPILHPQVVHGGDRPDAGIVDENVKLAVTLTRQVDETRHVLALSHVSLCIGHLGIAAKCGSALSSPSLVPN